MMDAILAIVMYAALQNNVKPELLLAICTQESDLRPKAVNLHDGGSASFGLCQLKVDTASRVFHRKVDAEYLIDPQHNAMTAAKLVRSLLDQYGNEECAIAAYNAGVCRKNAKGQIRNLKYVRRVQRRKKLYELVVTPQKGCYQPKSYAPHH